MKKIGYILFAALLAGCTLLEEPGVTPSPVVSDGRRVQISFNVAVPDGGIETKAMGLTPTIDTSGFYVAVFGGSGYFNEWVKATVVAATANYDTTGATMYSLKASLSVSDSRLRVHFIANCPEDIRNNPPISGSQDTEDNVMSKIRSQHSETYNDGYWQKLLLPNGVKAEKELINEGTEDEQEIWVPSQKTLDQFPDPIVLVRNFARVYLRNLTPSYTVDGVPNHHQLVTIKAFGLAYAPAEGPIAPMLAAPYSSNAAGSPIEIADDDDDTPVFYENFFVNYQNYPIESNDPNVTILTGPPFNYGGYSPDDQSYDYYTSAGHADPGIPLDADLQAWDSSNPENNVVFVYERTVPSAQRRATRIIIKAERRDEYNHSEGDKFYALDIVNTDGVSIPLLRNQTYTVHLLNIEAGSGESEINKASKASSATVSGDPTFQNLINISDGKSSIGTSFTEKFYVQPQVDSVMFRYIPTNIEEVVNEVTYIANKEYPELVSIDVGSVNTQTGVFTHVDPADAGGSLCFAVENNDYKVWIVKDNDDNVVQYVRSHNTWVEATQAQIADTGIEKWGMVKFQLSEAYKDSDNYFTQERSMAIHVLGSFNGRDMMRNVIIKTSPRQTMQVSCQQKYVMKKSGESEIVRILIPTGLSRSVFPLEFNIEPDGYSLTPYGDALPVSYGTSIIPGNTHPSYHFVKTLTETAYGALPTTTIGNTTWKVFDCHFKTTVADNACTVYVENRYFNDASSYDDFFNFDQRLFTNSSNHTTTLAFSPSTVYRHGNTELAFELDYAHTGNTIVWWDPNNTLNQSGNATEATEKGLSSSNRVLPPIFTVELLGFTPQYEADGETPVTRSLQHVSGNKYTYNVGSGLPTSDMVNITLALTGSGAIGTTATVKLTTANLTENPDLYAMNTVSTTLQGASFSNVRFGQTDNTTIDLGLDKTVSFRFTYTSGMVVPITIRLNGLALNGNGDHNLLMSANGDGTYTFTPTNTSTTTYYLSLKTTTRFTACSVTLSSDDYTEITKTANRSATTFTITAAKLRAGGSRPGRNTYVYAYCSTNYSNNSSRINSSGYYSTFSTSSPYGSSSALTVNLSRFSNPETDLVYFRYSSGNTYYYATASLADIYDAVNTNNATITLNFSTSAP